MELQIGTLIEDYRHQANEQSSAEIEIQIQNYELAKAILDTPRQHPKALHNQIKNKLGKRRLPFYVPHRILSKNSGLNTPEKRSKWVNIVRLVGDNLSRFAQGNIRENYKALHDDIRQTVFTEERTPRIQTKGILFIFYSTLPDDVGYKSTLEEVTRIANFDQSESLLHDVIDLIAVERGLVERRIARDRAIGRIARILVHLQTLRESNIPESEDVRIAHEVEDLREAIEIARQGLKSLQSDIDTIGDEARQEAFIAFFQEMNSVKHSYFLDQCLRADMQLERFKQQGTEIPREIEHISVLTPIFNQFLGAHSIQPKELVGEKIKLTLKESDNYEYIGSDFESMDEQKTVEVLSPGWTCEGRLIIKPRVREVG